MHVLFVRHAHPHVVLHVRTLSAALSRVGHVVSILDVPPGPPTVARRQLHAALRARHAVEPVDVVEWPDLDGLFDTPIPGIADVLRLHGVGSTRQRALALPHDEGRAALERSMWRRIPVWSGVSQSVISDARAVLAAPEHPAVVARPFVDTSVFAPTGAATAPVNASADAPVVLWMVDPADDPARSSLRCEAVMRAVREREPHVVLQHVGLADDEITLASAIRAASVTVASADFDADGRAILYAQACGVPVVGSLRGAGREIVQHGVSGLLADPDKPLDVARQVVSLLRSAPLRARMGAAGRAAFLQVQAQSQGVHDTLTCYSQAIERGTHESRSQGSTEEDPASNGFFLATSHSRTGYGVVGSHLLRALLQRQQPVHFVPIGPVDRSIIDNPALDLALASPPDLPGSAPSVRHAQQFDLLAHRGDGPRVAYTVFERDRFTDDERSQFEAQDAVLVCTEWAREVCLTNGVTRPVYVVPHGVDRTVFHEHVTPLATPPWDAGTDDTIFMQVGKLEPRKGQFELLCAFEEAFTPADPVRLVLHAHNPFVDPVAFERLASPFRESPMRERITLISRPLPTAHDVAALMAHAHCGVFAVRAEGWNLEALEMLSMGKAVIVSHVSGHTDFLDDSNARLINIDRLEPAMQGTLPGSWAAWDVSQHQQLVAHLRAVHAERQAGTLAPNRAGIATAAALSWDNAADALVEALTQVTRARREPH